MTHHLAGLAELAARWGLSRQGAWLITRRDDFPKPTKLAVGNVWDAEAVEAWELEQVEAGKPLPGTARRGPGRKKEE